MDLPIEGAERLIQSYGYMPSFHDAHVLAVRLGGKVIEMELYVYESPASGLWKQDWDADLHCLVTLRWSEISLFDISVSSVWLDSMSFQSKGQNIETRLVDQDSGVTGNIVSRTLEVLAVEPATERFRRQDGEPINFVRLSCRPV